MTDRPTLGIVVFPRSDVTLRRDVEAALRDVEGPPEARATVTLVERRLRRVYRNIQIHLRDSLGGYDDDPTAVWYVYRDGRVRSPNELRERLYAVLADARETTRSTQRALERSLGAARVAGYRAILRDDEPANPRTREPASRERRRRAGFRRYLTRSGQLGGLEHDGAAPGGRER